MLFKINSAVLYGIEAFIIAVEVDLSLGEKVNFFTVGLPDRPVRESERRIRAAIHNCGLEFPSHTLTINLAPADIKKAGSQLDLPMAIGVLGTTDALLRRSLDEFLILGELSLDGTVRPIKGALPIALASREAGIRRLLLPEANAREAAMVEGLDVHPVRSLPQVVDLLNGDRLPQAFQVDRQGLFRDLDHYPVDFQDVKGQLHAKRALEVACAGGHNILMIGPPGSGKTMLARRIPTILPPLSFEEAIETTKIHSVMGLVSAQQGMVSNRPFRAPHHTISDAGLIGGGNPPRPGEVSLAHHGVLFLDELPEFQRHVLAVLRQPLEDDRIVISRASMSVAFPARFMLAAAMNPCLCGHFNSGVKECTCTPPQIQRYLAKISGPLLDRVDIHIDVPVVPYKDLARADGGEGSAAIRERVSRARAIQLERFRGSRIYCNAQMTPKHLRKHCQFREECQRLLEHAITRLGLSARAYDRILKVSRTIADLEGQAEIQPRHVSEAIQYRSLDRNFWV